MIKLICNNVNWNLNLPEELLPEGGKPFDHHFKSTPTDNLIELCGRTCYDSAKSIKTRNSEDYHIHINEVNHTSVQESVNFVIEIPINNSNIADIVMWSCINRPGVFIQPTLNSPNLRITANLRAIREWSSKNNRIVDQDTQDHLGFCLQQLVKIKSPLVLSACTKESKMFVGKIVEPFWPEERWYNFYISGVSRGLTHELVRHKFQTAVSQRSTRYVDESESNWVWHPLIEKYKNNTLHSYDTEDGKSKIEIIMAANNLVFEKESKFNYLKIVEFLESKLVTEGIDKFTARKQARGAARGVLGNALNTELIWSCSLSQAVEVIKQRANQHADAEIRMLGCELYEILKDDILKHMGLKAIITDCPDGIAKNISLVAN